MLLNTHAQRTALASVVFALTALVLLAVSVLSYAVFYWSYVPDSAVTKHVFLHYGHGTPHATLDLRDVSPSLFADQPYDVALSLHVPPSSTNLALGNFMVTLEIHAYPLPPPPSPPTTSEILSDPSAILARTTKPGLLQYKSHIERTLSDLIKSPLYLTGLSHQVEHVRIPLLDSWSFPGGLFASTPAAARLEISTPSHPHGAADLQIASAHLTFSTHYRGLRWFLHNHRLISFLLFVSIFWGAGCLFAGVMYWFVAAQISNGTRTGRREESRDLGESDADDYEFVTGNFGSSPVASTLRSRTRGSSVGTSAREGGFEWESVVSGSTRATSVGAPTSDKTKPGRR
ncbi:hypothetical protein SAICODRAFT_73822 [Saitoella complicata NRRL Y-17804]|uniref:Seipin n=1 Tax=Saitoella complicata (strain BCRC 22490 / CBS 7301 / JCM 7358 / NBRC 10748 / NRRL Y-17804) TaxID=698492 RepID=A0A0E9NE97_SAICN|nr:uncharacterized protein SAICODRAFT_73822 [Saitoella complicata NRRL Y-17804]ODQ49841.1 hypothetical protein SAICODRAFT_73822 [Saitoella complicata NRRL Y-17804]GAO47735.1 hypothetical protein G7K_1934-t1 [Saitoella complicata NRRL Y-17804]